MDYSIIVNNLVIIFLMIAVGFAAGKAKLCSDRASADFTTFLMQIALPCMIFNSMIREFEVSMLRDSVIALGTCFVLILLLLAGLVFLSGKLKMEETSRGTWTFAVTFGNSGFMGIPLILAIFGTDGLFVAAIMGIAYLGIQYTLCIRMMCHFSGRTGDAINWKKILLSNTNIALMAGLIFFIFQISVPGTLHTVVNGFGSITTPLSMFLIGWSLSRGNIWEAFRDRDVITCTFMRLIAVPVLTAGILHLLPFTSPLVRGVILLSYAMPCPSLAMIFSQEYGGNVELASRSIFLSSLCCLVTIPLVMLLL